MTLERRSPLILLLVASVMSLTAGGCFASSEAPPANDVPDEPDEPDIEPRVRFAIIVRTDFVPVEDFDSVRSTSDGQVSEREVLDADWAEGVTVATWMVPLGPRTATVELLDGDEVIASRNIAIEISEDTEVTAFITRSCRDRDCDSPPDTPPPDPGCNAPELLANSCAVNASCHGPGWGFDVRVDEAELIETLSNADAGGSCTGDQLLVPGDADNSALYLRLTGTTCGNQMPQTGDYFSDGELECVRAWISAL